jgi:hypothetical protein
MKQRHDDDAARGTALENTLLAKQQQDSMLTYVHWQMQDIGVLWWTGKSTQVLDRSSSYVSHKFSSSSSEAAGEGAAWPQQKPTKFLQYVQERREDPN